MEKRPGTVVTNACDDETGDGVALHFVQVPAEIDDRPNGLGDEENAISETAVGLPDEPASERRRHNGTGQLVVRQRWMTDIGGEKNLLVLPSRQDELPVGERARLECGVNNCVIATGLKLVALLLR